MAGEQVASVVDQGNTFGFEAGHGGGGRRLDVSLRAPLGDVQFRVVAAAQAPPPRDVDGAAGAFEATLLVALPPLGFTAEAVVAAFILFRLYYFIGPFVLALIVVAIREFAGGRGSLDHLKESMAVIREAEASQEAAKAAAKPGPQA